jgi:mannose-6-phosphate isomerase-like protein (cupin superfamily)
MRYVAKASAQRFDNSSSCTVFEYGGDSELSGAVAHIHGRYPESGWALNQRSKEMAYVLKGTGVLTTKEMSVSLHKGDMALIDANEPYFFEGSELEIFIPTNPAWTPDQYTTIES